MIVAAFLEEGAGDDTEAYTDIRLHLTLALRGCFEPFDVGARIADEVRKIDIYCSA